MFDVSFSPLLRGVGVWESCSVLQRGHSTILFQVQNQELGQGHYTHSSVTLLKSGVAI